jgi:hypothetical protein
MEMHLNKIYNFLKSSVGILALSIAVLTTSCEPNQSRNDTESNQDFAGEDNLPTSDPNDSTNVPGEVRKDSTPASNADLDDNPIIDKGVSTDSAWNNDDKKRRKQ